MKKKKEEPLSLSADDLKAAVRRLRDLSVEIKALEKEHKQVEQLVIATLGIGGLMAFEDLRVKVVQALRRIVPWRQMAMSLARMLYPGRREFNNWLRELVRRYPKKESAPFAKLTMMKESEV